MKIDLLNIFLKLNFSEFPWINSTIQRCYSASVIPKSVENMFCWAFSVDFVGIARISRYYRLKEGNLCDCWRHAKLCRMHLFDTHLEEVVKKGEMDLDALGLKDSTNKHNISLTYPRIACNSIYKYSDRVKIVCV